MLTAAVIHDYGMQVDRLLMFNYRASMVAIP